MLMEARTIGIDGEATLDDEELRMLLRLLPAGEALTLIVVRRLQIGRGPPRCLLVGSPNLRLDGDLLVRLLLLVSLPD
ncbi:hypothetical protein ACLOJK_037266 [Asimina triloba]